MYTKYFAVNHGSQTARQPQAKMLSADLKTTVLWDVLFFAITHQWSTQIHLILVDESPHNILETFQTSPHVVKYVGAIPPNIH